MLYEEGEYALTAVKEIQVTDDFLDIKTKNCQIKESYEDCTTRSYLQRVELECKCLPYRLRNFTAKNQEVFRLKGKSQIISHFITDHLYAYRKCLCCQNSSEGQKLSCFL